MLYTKIIEELNNVHSNENFFNSLKRSTNLDINESFDYLTKEDIDEGTAVTFNGKVFPESGQAVILVGSPGSGKGFIRKNRILGDFKVFDVDELKNLYLSAQKKGKFDDTTEYDLRNSEDVSSLHKKVKALKWKDMKEKAFLDNLTAGRLPNVLYDITGDDSNKLKTLSAKLKSLGYKISVVWVVTNRQVAMMQNLTRDRVVSQEIFHRIHNDVIKNVFPFIKKDASDCDEAWLVFNSLDSAKKLTTKEREYLNKIGIVKLEKKGSGFEIPREIEMMVYNILGPEEVDPSNPKVYRDFKEVFGNEEEIKRVEAGHVSLLKR